MKLVVEVLDASDLKPKDGQGSASPFVEVDFAEQRHRTQTKLRDLNPVWNETLVFDVPDPSLLADSTVDVSVYNDRGPGHRRNFLGRVRLSGASVASSAAEAGVRRCPLDKRGILSHIRGEIGLRVYAADHHGAGAPTPKQPETPAAVPAQVPAQAQAQTKEAPPVPDAGGGDDKKEAAAAAKGGDLGGGEEKKAPKKSTKNPEDGVRHFHSIGSSPPVVTEAKRAEAPPAAVAVMHMHGGGPGPGPRPMMVPPPGGPGQNKEFDVKETRPPLAGYRGYRGDKISSTYDLVEQMYFLYVNVVKAKDLPAKDITGSLDPYVEVKLGNYRGTTKVLEKNQNPIWLQVFAFSKERVQSNVLEVVVKDKDLVKDDYVGRVHFDLTDVPLRVPPDSPLAPQWYRLENKKGEKEKGEIMLGVWMGTQADEAFPDAWHSDAHSVGAEALAYTRSKVYFSPKLWYLRVQVIEAQDLLPTDHGRAPECQVRVEIGGQRRLTRPSQVRTINPGWNEELLFVASEPWEDPLIITVVDRVGPGKDEEIGRIVLHVPTFAPVRLDHNKLPDTKWFSLEKPSKAKELTEEEKKKEPKFASKIHLRLCLDGGYHVLDESTHYSSDLQPSARQLRKPSIGVLEVGILSARNLVPMKAKSGRTTDAYCLAKYGRKWVRTRTLLDTLHPRWNEQYTWEVLDPCTVITIGVFDNCHIEGKDGEAKDQRIGKVRIRLSTLETNRIYTHYYPLLILQPPGLKKTGELHLAVRFTCTAWVSMMSLYARPLLPKMHYVQPIQVMQLDYLRRSAMQIVAARLSRAEPPLRRETVEYMLDVDSNMFSLRRSKANFYRIINLFSGVMAVGRWFNSICSWRNPVTTILVHVLFLILVCYPELILPTIFLYLFMIGMWNYRFRPRNPPHMDTKLSHAEQTHPDELDEEFDSFPTGRPSDIVRMRYDRLRSVSGRVQTVVGDLATQGERAQAILSWRDPRATSIFVILALILAVILYVTPFQVIAMLVGMYLLRHPKFRTKMPSVPFNFYRRLPSKSDMLL